MKLLRRPISASDRILDRFYIISMELLSLSRRRSSSRNVLQRRWARRNVCCSQAKNYDKVALWYKEVATRIDCCRILCCFLLSSYKYIWNVRCLYLIWNLAKTFQRNDLSRTIHPAGYEFCRAAAIWAMSKGSLQYTLLQNLQWTENLLISKSWQFSRPWRLQLLSSTNVLFTLMLSELSPTNSPFSSRQISTLSLPINWPSLVSIARSPIILWRGKINKIASKAFFQLRSDKPWHKHDSNKCQSKAFFKNLRPEIKSGQSAMHIDKKYLVWLMYG